MIAMMLLNPIFMDETHSIVNTIQYWGKRWLRGFLSINRKYFIFAN